MFCCEYATEEQIEYEADSFDCQTCPIAKASSELWPENLDAWKVFQQLARRLVVDVGLGPEVFRRLTDQLDSTTFENTLDRLNVIYDVVLPPPKRD